VSAALYGQLPIRIVESDWLKARGLVEARVTIGGNHYGAGGKTPERAARWLHGDACRSGVGLHEAARALRYAMRSERTATAPARLGRDYNALERGSGGEITHVDSRIPQPYSFGVGDES
jgi:hypothetical protein